MQEMQVWTLGQEDSLEEEMVTHSSMMLLFSCSVVSNSLPPHGLQHARLPYLSLSQTHVHWVDDAIQPSHPLSSPSPPALNLSQHLGLFQWVTFLYQLAKRTEASASVFPMIIQCWFPLRLTGLISSVSKGLSRVFSTTVRKHQF